MMLAERKTAKSLKDNDLDESIFVVWRMIKDQETESNKLISNQTLGIFKISIF